MGYGICFNLKAQKFSVIRKIQLIPLVYVNISGGLGPVFIIKITKRRQRISTYIES